MSLWLSYWHHSIHTELGCWNQELYDVDRQRSPSVWTQRPNFFDDLNHIGFQTIYSPAIDQIRPRLYCLFSVAQLRVRGGISASAAGVAASMERSSGSCGDLESVESIMMET